MTKILNVASHSVDLDDGRVLAPGEDAVVNTDDPHNKVLIDQGSILVVESTPKASATGEKPKNDGEDKKS